MKLYLSHSSGFDYQAELYDPLKQYLVDKHDIFFPHDIANVNAKARDIIANSDCMLAEVSSTSTGQGIELGWADVNNVPIVCFYRSGAKTSHSLKFVCNTLIEYGSSDDMVAKLEEWLNKQ